MKRLEILLIDEDTYLFELLFTFMDLAGFHLLHTRDCSEDFKMVDELNPDLILLDIMIPGIDSWNVVRLLRGKSLSLMGR